MTRRFLISGILLVITGCFLFVNHAWVTPARILLAAGVLAEIAALFLYFKHIWSRKRG